jgi:hypothetical protein
MTREPEIHFLQHDVCEERACGRALRKTAVKRASFGDIFRGLGVNAFLFQDRHDSASLNAREKVLRTRLKNPRGRAGQRSEQREKRGGIISMERYYDDERQSDATLICPALRVAAAAARLLRCSDSEYLSIDTPRPCALHPACRRSQRG